MRRTIHLKQIVMILSVTALLFGCSRDNEVVTPPVTSVVSVTISHLPQLAGDEGHYQVWATFSIFQNIEGSYSPLHDSGLVSLGEFIVASDGQSLLDPENGQPAEFSIPVGKDPRLITDVVITIQQPETGLSKLIHEEPGPAIIGGRFRGTASLGVADLSADYEDAFGTDFSSVTGTYTLIAPTSVPADSNSGVWFYEQLPSPVASLHNLASLGAGWKYEGWVVDRAPVSPLYYSTGKFSRADSADVDGPGPGSGSGAGLNFPGQDFITGTPTLPNLSDSRYAIRITIEPQPDNSPRPFFLTLLSTDVAMPAGIGHAAAGTFLMQNVIATHLPTARITVSR